MTAPAQWVRADRFGRVGPRLPGSYVLVVRLGRPAEIRAGKRPARIFSAGCYAYAGSALGGLRQRLGRYAAPGRKLHWHIDYVLAEATVVGAWILPGTERLECPLARILGRRAELVAGFGSSDCGCPGHLFFASDGLFLRERAMRTLLSDNLLYCKKR
ncbi:MAG: GIY-YIG nuclease family protein [Acidobacteria bacterium]|nr:GIY-YIG nuclease family protein [Acidobacteriota bacterium]